MEGDNLPDREKERFGSNNNNKGAKQFGMPSSSTLKGCQSSYCQRLGACICHDTVPTAMAVMTPQAQRAVEGKRLLSGNVRKSPLRMNFETGRATFSLNCRSDRDIFDDALRHEHIIL